MLFHIAFPLKNPKRAHVCLCCLLRFYTQYSLHRKIMDKTELRGTAESDDVSVSADALLILPTNRHVNRTMTTQASAAVPQHSLYAASSRDVM